MQQKNKMPDEVQNAFQIKRIIKGSSAKNLHRLNHFNLFFYAYHTQWNGNDYEVRFKFT